MAASDMDAFFNFSFLALLLQVNKIFKTKLDYPFQLI